MRKLKEDFITAVGNTNKKLIFYPTKYFDEIENKFMTTLDEFEKLQKINVLLQQLMDESKKKINGQYNHPVDTEEEVRILKAKILDLTRRYEATEAINLDQNIQLEKTSQFSCQSPNIQAQIHL